MASLIKRGEVYYARHIYRVNGKRKEKVKSLDTTDRRTAVKRLANFELEIEAGKHGEVARVTFDHAARRWLEAREPHIKEKSMKRFRWSLRRLLPHFGDMVVTDIKVQQISAYVTKRKAAKGRGHGKRMSGQSIHNELSVIGTVFRWLAAHEMYGVTVNPFANYMRAEGKADLSSQNARTRYLSHDEQSRLLNSIMQSRSSLFYRDVLHDFCLFTIETGLRQGELYLLEWSNVHLTQTAAHIWVAPETTKTGRGRRVPLSPVAQMVLRRRPRANSGNLVFWLPGREDTAIVSLRQGFDAATARAGIADANLHDLRRTAGCRWLQDKRASIYEVSKLLGHSSVAVTERHYAFLRTEDLDDVVSRPSIRELPQPAEVIPLRRIGAG